MSVYALENIVGKSAHYDTEGNRMKTLGVIGGLGPMATAYFMQLVIEMTDAATDQQHIPMVIYNAPQIPDRTGFLLGKSTENPVPAIVEIGRKLSKDGADIIAIPCITAHALHESIQEQVPAEIIHAIVETVEYLHEEGIKCVGLEATDGTVETRVFQKHLEDAGISVILPSAESQKKVMHFIYDEVKAGKPVAMDDFEQVENELLDRGAEAIILGCTELSMIKRDHELPDIYLDTLEVLARKSVLECGKLRPEYNRLLRLKMNY